MLTIKVLCLVVGVPCTGDIWSAKEMGVVWQKALVGCTALNQHLPTGMSHSCHKWVIRWKEMDPLGLELPDRAKNYTNVRKHCLLGKWYCFTQLSHANILCVLWPGKARNIALNKLLAIAKPLLHLENGAGEWYSIRYCGKERGHPFSLLENTSEVLGSHFSPPSSLVRANSLQGLHGPWFPSLPVKSQSLDFYWNHWERAISSKPAKYPGYLWKSLYSFWLSSSFWILVSLSVN